ncbi:MAG: hypothetical protein NT079_03025 [Candidatus Omnitrophica bacterium]|nr:hypothetical protein [Candidatus Omnitrophota bacterium]
MKRNLLEKLPSEIATILRFIGGYADQCGISCYLVGGVVRDLLLEKKNLDLDIVVEADAVEFSKTLSQKHQTAITIYPRFKTTTLIWPKNISIDFVSARKESYPTPGALPVVKKGTLRDDLFRRDFTVNAMAVSLNQPKYGLLVDEYHGLSDLKAKQIRIFHDQSFRDDPTRILRAIRFEQRYGFELEKKTMACLVEALKGDFYRHVTPGRYFEEFKKVLEEPDPERYLNRLDKLRALCFIDENFKFTPDKGKHIRDVDKILEWVQEFCPEVRGHSKWLVYFMILIDDYPSDTINKMLGRFSFSRHDRDKVISSKLAYEVVRRLDDQVLKPSQICKVLKNVSLEELVVFLVKTQGMAPETCIKKFLTNYRMTRLLLKGDDLVKLGVKDGKKMGEILQHLLERKIDSGITTKEGEAKLLEQIDWAKKGDFHESN